MSYTVKSLRDQCKAMGLRGYSKMNKPQLEEALTRYGGFQRPSVQEPAVLQEPVVKKAKQPKEVPVEVAGPVAPKQPKAPNAWILATKQFRTDNPEFKGTILKGSDEYTKVMAICDTMKQQKLDGFESKQKFKKTKAVFEP